ncbi:MAG: hypothetical protein RIT14_2029 [Pseudomonadota bacterium]|jgi:hypothetical protein
MPRSVALSGPASRAARPRTDIRSSDTGSHKGALALFFVVYVATLGLIIAPDGFFIGETATIAQD